MANGIAIKDVDNKLQSLEGEEVIPISTGANEPEVVEVDTLKEYINVDIDTALEGKQDIISDLATIRSGAALGATALQSYTESDPTVPAWAKESQKPSYSYSEITGKPALSTVATSGSYNDLTNKPNIPAVPTNVSAFTNDAGYLTEHQDISGKANSDDLATVAFSGDYEDLENTPTIPDVPQWAMSSTKPSYTVSEISGAQEELVSGTNIKTINNESILGSGNITIQGGGGDVNVIESITFNGSAVPVDGSKNAAITYSAPVTSVNGNTGDVTISIPTKVSDLTNDSGFITSYTETDPVFSASAAASITSADITSWNGKSTFSGSYNDLTDKPTLFSGAYADLTGKPNLATVATSGDYDDLSNKPTIPSAVTESTVSGWGFTKNAGTITGITMNGASKGTSGVVDLGTVITEHQSLTNYVQKSQTSGLLKNDGTVDTTAYTTNTGTVTSTGGDVTVNNIQVVSALPDSPDTNTLYLIPES
jgi:hypothetical protein